MVVVVIVVVDVIIVDVVVDVVVAPPFVVCLGALVAVMLILQFVCSMRCLSLPYLDAPFAVTAAVAVTVAVVVVVVVVVAAAAAAFLLLLLLLRKSWFNQMSC